MTDLARPLRILIGHRDVPLPAYDTARYEARVVRYGPDGQMPPVTIAEMSAQCPPGWKPDVYYHHALVHFPIPTDIEAFDGLTVTDIQDWHRGGRGIWAGSGFFDLIATERNAITVLQANGYQNAVFARFWGVDPGLHRMLPGVERDIDVLFVGSLTSAVWEERNRWIDRVARLSDRYRVLVAVGHFGEDYVRLVNRAKIVFNRSVNGDTNQRAYEGPVCGALVFNEEENEETREIFQDRVHCVYYNNENFESLLDYYLTHEDERARIVANAREKVLAEHTESAHLDALWALLGANLDRPRYRPYAELPLAERCVRKAMQMYSGALPAAVPTALGLLEEAERAGYDRATLQEMRGALLAWTAHFATGDIKIKQFTSALPEIRQSYQAKDHPVQAALTYGFVLLERAEATQGAHPTGRNDIIEAAVALATTAEQCEHNQAALGGFGYPHWRDAFDAHVERAYLLRNADERAWSEALRSVLAWRSRSMLSDLAFANAQHEEALNQARRAADDLPTDGEAWLRLARCEATVGLLEEAILHYRAGLALLPLAFTAWPELVMLLMALGRVEEAQAFVEERLRVLDAIPAFATIRPLLIAALNPGPLP